MPLNIPSVDLTRSQGYDDGDLTARNTLTYNTQRIITMATVSTAESMAPEDSKKRSMVRSQRIFGIELPLMLFFMVILIIGVIGAMPLWIGFFTSHWTAPQPLRSKAHRYQHHLTYIDATRPGTLYKPNAEQVPRYIATMRRSSSMQQVKTYTSGMFKREARYQFLRNIKKMAKGGWHVHTVTDEGVGTGQNHTGHLTVVYKK